MTEFAHCLAWGALGVFAAGCAYALIQFAKSLIAYRRWRRRIGR
jgi:hypothetical protein